MPQQRDLTTGGRLPNTPWGGEKRYGAFCLEAKEASETLVRIERGDLGRTILLWIPLMKGADDSATVATWARLAREDPSPARRAELAGLALVFASWRGLQELWGPTLEGFDVEQIEIVRRWKNSARREDLRLVLRRRFSVELPEDVNQAIQQVQDSDQLSHWFDLALTTTTFAEFREAVLSPTANGTARS